MAWHNHTLFLLPIYQTCISTYILYDALDQFIKSQIRMVKPFERNGFAQMKFFTTEIVGSWLADRGYKSEIIWPKVQKVNVIDRNTLLKKCLKYQEDSITLVINIHATLHIAFDVLNRANRHVQNPPLLKAVVSKPLHVGFRNPKILSDKFVRSWS